MSHGIGLWDTTKGIHLNLNNLKIAFVICILALPGCASGTGKSKAIDSASLTRVNDDPPVRVALMFTSVTAFEEGVLFDRERDDMDETVVRLHCADMVPEHVSVICSQTGLVAELKDDPFVYEISANAVKIDVIYDGGNGIVKRTFTVDDGELALSPVEVAANFRH